MSKQKTARVTIDGLSLKQNDKVSWFWRDEETTVKLPPCKGLEAVDMFLWTQRIRLPVQPYAFFGTHFCFVTGGISIIRKGGSLNPQCVSGLAGKGWASPI